MKNSFKSIRRVVTGILAATLVAMVVAPAEAQDRHRSQSWQRPHSGGYGGHYSGGYGRHYSGGYSRHYSGGHGGPHYGGRYYSGGVYVDGGLALGVLGLGIMADAVMSAQRPVVVYQQQPPYPSQYQYPRYDPQEYPPPRRYYPECKEFVGNPGAMAFCEKGVLERANEEQRLLEQKAYETGRGR
jgi:hypothetical protein